MKQEKQERQEKVKAKRYCAKGAATMFLQKHSERKDENHEAHFEAWFTRRFSTGYKSGGSRKARIPKQLILGVLFRRRLPNSNFGVFISLGRFFSPVNKPRRDRSFCLFGILILAGRQDRPPALTIVNSRFKEGIRCLEFL